MEDSWGFSSVGRAPALQAGGQRFDPANLHHFSELKIESGKLKIKRLTEAKDGIRHRLLH